MMKNLLNRLSSKRGERERERAENSFFIKSAKLLVQGGVFGLGVTAIFSISQAWTGSGNVVTDLKNIANAGIPSGAVVAFNKTSCPSGWSLADGGSSRPDLRGRFVRGLEVNISRDSGRSNSASSSLRTFQHDAGRNITGTLGAPYKSGGYSGAFNSMGGSGGPTGCCGPWFTKLSFDASRSWGTDHTSTEFRPANVALLYCVKN